MVPTLSSDRPIKPRVAGDRENEILDAVIDLLAEHGYDKLTYDLVASSARASKATLYRKWESKSALTIDAIEHLFERSVGPHGEHPDTGTLVGDLEAMFCGSSAMLEEVPQILAATLPALQRDPVAQEALIERFLAPKHAALVDLLRRAQDRGEVGAGANLELLASIIPSMNAYKVLAQGICPDPAFVRSIVDEVLLPACRATLRH